MSRMFKKIQRLRSTAMMQIAIAGRTLRLAYTMTPHDLILSFCITFASAILPFVLTYTNMLVIDELIRVSSQHAPDFTRLITYALITLSVGYAIDILWRYGEFVHKRMRFALLREFGYLLHAKTAMLDLEHFELRSQD